MEWNSIDKQRLPERYSSLAHDAYDNCLAYLDEQLGKLFDELTRRGVVDRTAVIITSDHGEGLGEHELFTHGESLYRTEIGVPLLILTPSHRPSGAVVWETVSLRDLPATIVDMIGLANMSPFPGRSLARFWAERPAGGDRGEPEVALSELGAPNPTDPNHGRSPIHRGSLISLAEGDFVYIFNDGDGAEELFNQRIDPNEVNNLTGVASVQTIVRRFRDYLQRVNRATSAVRDRNNLPRVATRPNHP